MATIDEKLAEFGHEYFDELENSVLALEERGERDLAKRFWDAGLKRFKKDLERPPLNWSYFDYIGNFHHFPSFVIWDDLVPAPKFKVGDLVKGKDFYGEVYSVGKDGVQVLTNPNDKSVRNFVSASDLRLVHQ